MAENKPKETRIKQIIDTAVLEFIEKGYESTSMESIAKRANLSKGGLYYHFKSKDEILIEANNRFMQPIEKLIETALLNPSPVAGLKAYIRAYLNHWQAHPRELAFTFLSLTKIMSYAEMWPEMEEYFNSITAFYKAMLQTGIHKNELKKHDIDSRALALAAALDGVTSYLVMCQDLTSSSVANNLIQTFISEVEVERDA